MHSRGHHLEPEDLADFKTLAERLAVPGEAEETPAICLNSSSGPFLVEEQAHGLDRGRLNGERISSRPSTSLSWNRARASRRRSRSHLSWNARHVRALVSSREHQGTRVRRVEVPVSRHSRYRA